MNLAKIIEEQTGYRCLAHFDFDFGVAEKFGEDAICKTFTQLFNQHKDDVKMFTELVLILNWLIWAWYGKNDELATLYDGLWRQADDYGCEHFKGDDASYFFRTLD